MSAEKVCGVCGYSWVSNIENPKCCPRCKRYDWLEKGDRQPLESTTACGPCDTRRTAVRDSREKE